jgi:Protein of unknown function (DUF2971).
MTSDKIGTKLLYHYTNMQGLLGIIGGKSLWATDILYQNDSSEFDIGKKMFLDQIGQIFPKFLPNFNNAVLSNIEEMLLYYETHIFTISFSEEKNSLNQYRSYSKDLSGVSIGFDVNKILENKDKRLNCGLFKCRYTDEDQKTFIEIVLGEFLFGISNNYVLDTLSMAILVGKIITYAPIIKHSSFIEEKEWRLIIVNEEPISNFYKFRPGESYIIPYLEIPIEPENIIKEIYLGPTPNEKLALKSLKEYCSKNNILAKDTNNKINYCEIPYRSW